MTSPNSLNRSSRHLTRNPLNLRVILFAFAGVLGCFAVWSLAGELLRPTGFGFPTDSQSAASIYKQRKAASIVAKVGLVRGDLWADAAFAYGGFFII